MLTDLRRDKIETELSADVVVVGAGAVGLTLAADLAQRGLDVLVLEAGGPGPSSESQAFFEQARNTGRNLQGLHLGRFRALGGTTNFWGGQLVPLEPSTFGPRPWVADAHWPIGHAEIAPFYPAVMDLVGLSRRIDDDAEVWRRLGIKPPPDTPDLNVFFTRWAPEPNFARLFDGLMRQSSRLRVCLHAPVTGLAMEGSQVTAAVIRSPDGAARVVKGRRFILANGAIEIPRLLLCGLADGQSAPWSDNPWIGHGFMDHLDCDAGPVEILDKKRFHDLFDNAFINGIKYNPRIKLSEDAQLSRKLLGISSQFVFRSSLSENIANAKIFLKAISRGRASKNFVHDITELMSLTKVLAPMIARYLRDRRMYNLADAGVQLRLASEQKPLYASHLSLRRERDALGMPMIDLDWKVDGGELETLATFAELAADYLADSGLAKLNVDPALAARDPGFISKLQDSNHQMGTTRISTNPKDGVVDADLKVHGADNLFAVGASVYPTAGFSNPTFTAMALGLRLANHIAEARP